MAFLRVTFLLVAAVSFVLCLAFASAWVRGRFAEDVISWEREWVPKDDPVYTRRSLFVRSGGGSLFFNVIFQREASRPPRDRRVFEWKPAPASRFSPRGNLIQPIVFDVAGVGVGRLSGDQFGQHVSSVLLPYWL